MKSHQPTSKASQVGGDVNHLILTGVPQLISDRRFQMSGLSLASDIDVLPGNWLDVDRAHLVRQRKWKMVISPDWADDLG